MPVSTSLRTPLLLFIGAAGVSLARGLLAGNNFFELLPPFKIFLYYLLAILLPQVVRTRAEWDLLIRGCFVLAATVAIRAGVDAGDFEPFARIVEVLGSPYDEQPGNERYAAPPTPDQIVRETFCGT